MTMVLGLSKCHWGQSTINVNIREYCDLTPIRAAEMTNPDARHINLQEIFDE